MTTGHWHPDHVRRQVMRQARYALNVAILNEDRVPPEGPCDVALTNGLLAVVGAIDTNAITNKKGFTLAARDLLPVAVSLGLDIDMDVLTEGLDFTQPLRHAEPTTSGSSSGRSTSTLCVRSMTSTGSRCSTRLTSTTPWMP